jgi:hypothetical protein
VQVITERFSIEMAELDEAERRLEEAEEEELWLLTLHQQARHMHVSGVGGFGAVCVQAAVLQQGVVLCQQQHKGMLA